MNETKIAGLLLSFVTCAMLACAGIAPINAGSLLTRAFAIVANIL